MTLTAPQTATFADKGGTLEVTYTPNAMTIVQVVPASGWTVKETSADPDEIEVQFERGGDDSKIHIRLVGGVPQLQADD